MSSTRQSRVSCSSDASASGGLELKILNTSHDIRRLLPDYDEEFALIYTGEHSRCPGLQASARARAELGTYLHDGFYSVVLDKHGRLPTKGVLQVLVKDGVECEPCLDFLRGLTVESIVRLRREPTEKDLGGNPHHAEARSPKNAVVQHEPRLSVPNGAVTGASVMNGHQAEECSPGPRRPRLADPRPQEARHHYARYARVKGAGEHKNNMRGGACSRTTCGRELHFRHFPLLIEHISQHMSFCCFLCLTIHDSERKLEKHKRSAAHLRKWCLASGGLSPNEEWETVNARALVSSKIDGDRLYPEEAFVEDGAVLMDGGHDSGGDCADEQPLSPDQKGQVPVLQEEGNSMSGGSAQCLPESEEEMGASYSEDENLPLEVVLEEFDTEDGSTHGEPSNSCESGQEVVEGEEGPLDGGEEMGHGVPGQQDKGEENGGGVLPEQDQIDSETGSTHLAQSNTYESDEDRPLQIVEDKEGSSDESDEERPLKIVEDEDGLSDKSDEEQLWKVVEDEEGPLDGGEEMGHGVPDQQDKAEENGGGVRPEQDQIDSETGSTHLAQSNTYKSDEDQPLKIVKGEEGLSDEIDQEQALEIAEDEEGPSRINQLGEETAQMAEKDVVGKEAHKAMKRRMESSPSSIAAKKHRSAESLVAANGTDAPGPESAIPGISKTSPPEGCAADKKTLVGVSEPTNQVVDIPVPEIAVSVSKERSDVPSTSGSALGVATAFAPQQEVIAHHLQDALLDLSGSNDLNSASQQPLTAGPSVEPDDRSGVLLKYLKRYSLCGRAINHPKSIVRGGFCRGPECKKKTFRHMVLALQHLADTHGLFCCYVCLSFVTSEEKFKEHVMGVQHTNNRKTVKACRLANSEEEAQQIGLDYWRKKGEEFNPGAVSMKKKQKRAKEGPSQCEPAHNG